MPDAHTPPIPCPLCAVLTPSVHIPFGEALDALYTACTMSCRCMDQSHEPLALHPHARPGCAGYAEVPHD